MFSSKPFTVSLLYWFHVLLRKTLSLSVVNAINNSLTISCLHRQIDNMAQRRLESSKVVRIWISCKIISGHPMGRELTYVVSFQAMTTDSHC